MEFCECGCFKDWKGLSVREERTLKELITEHVMGGNDYYY